MDLVGEKGYFIFGKNPLFRPLCSARHAAAHSVVSDGGAAGGWSNLRSLPTQLTAQ